ncbi:uncharacterized protein LOC131932876 [Physella acuta]|uniref:uncharacterized protein LOC131932876 n=1 Tax=Physella acuta TaxID=109671 RepID=UPI0027DE8CBB|nr:uncharacterized protein LOC131932876 [Physella acuta]
MTSFTSMACGLPGDDVAYTMENEVLKKWGFPDTFIELSSNRNEFDENVETPENDIYASANTATSTGNKSADVDEDKVPDESTDEDYEMAHAAYQSGQYCDCLIYLDDAFLSLSPTNALKLWTLKANLMNAMEDHLEALRAISNIDLSHMTFELFIAGAVAMEKLGLLITAEHWLKKVVMATRKTASSEGSAEQWAHRAFHMLQEIHTRRTYEPYIKGAKVKVTNTSSGRGLHATRNISKDEVIFTELPEVCEQSIATCNILACAHCGLSLAKPQNVFPRECTAVGDNMKTFKKVWVKREVTQCNNCNRVVYCSESCRQESWTKYHKVLCSSAQNTTTAMLYDVRQSFTEVRPSEGGSWQGWWNVEFSPVLLARLWATIVCRAKLDMGQSQQPSKIDWVKAGSQFEKYTGKGSNSAHETIPKMFELLATIFKRSKTLRYDITKEDFDKRHSQILTNYITFYDDKDPLRHFIDKLAQDRKRYKRMSKYLQEPLPRAEFHGLFPLASTINHSCLPNAEIISTAVNGRPGICVQAVENIAAGDEIFVSYINPDQDKAGRRQALWRRYKFICQCIKCTFQGDGPDTCTHCGKTVADVDRFSGSNRSSGQDTGVFSQPNKDTPTDLLSSADGPNKDTPTDLLSSADGPNKDTPTDLLSSADGPNKDTPTDLLSADGPNKDTSTDLLSSANSPNKDTPTDLSESDQRSNNPPAPTPQVSDDLNFVSLSVNCNKVDNVVDTNVNNLTNSISTSNLVNDKESKFCDTQLSSNNKDSISVESQIDFNSSTLEDNKHDINDTIVSDERKHSQTGTDVLAGESPKNELATENQHEHSSCTVDESVPISPDLQQVLPHCENPVESPENGLVTENQHEHSSCTVNKNPVESPENGLVTENQHDHHCCTVKDCGETSQVSQKMFPHCGRCGAAWYCSQVCQREAWKKGHKKICLKQTKL